MSAIHERIGLAYTAGWFDGWEGETTFHDIDDDTRNPYIDGYTRGEQARRTATDGIA